MIGNINQNSFKNKAKWDQPFLIVPKSKWTNLEPSPGSGT
jgi:hypothetical protein